MKPYKYWNSRATYTTTNAQMPVGEPSMNAIPIVRNVEDTVTRSIWCAEIAYISPGTSTTIDGWWAAAFARLVVWWDPFGENAPEDIDGESDRILGFIDLKPTYTLTKTAGKSAVVWNMNGGILDLKGERKGIAPETFGQVIGAVFYGDQNGVWAGAAEAGGQRRSRISGRVLFESSDPPP